MISNEKENGMSKAFDKWQKFYCQKQQGLMWPNETLVRFFKATYMPGHKENYENKKVLDIGFGTGNNLMFLGTLGMKLYGIEVQKDICEQGMDRLMKMGYSADFRVGTNAEIPFKDNFFDYILSWDVLHYEGQEDKIKKAIKEYHRVLKPGGRLYLSTVAPRHTILKDSETLGIHQYRIGLKTDFRKGQVFFYFDRPEYIQFYFSSYFSDVQVGRVTLDYFGDINDTFIMTAVNRR